MPQYRITATLALLFLCLLLSACNRKSDVERLPANSVEEGHLRLTGASTMAPLMTEIALRFSALHPKVMIDIDMGGSERGISDARDGKADIGMVSRLVTDKDEYIKGFPIGRDGTGFIVQNSNPVRALRSDQIKDIFRGRITNWSMVGGRNAPITVIQREPGRGTVVFFLQHFNLTYSEIISSNVLGENAEVIAAVAAQPNAISLMSVIVAENNLHAGVQIKLVAIDGIAATHTNILSGDYPFARPLTLVTRGLPTGLAKSLIDYSLSLQVADIVGKMGFVPYQE